MAPDGLVKVWILLQARLDISCVVREIVGHFTLLSVGNPSTNKEIFKLFVWIKVIFDIQRTHLQAARPSNDSLSCLLPSRVLFDTIHHVLQTISQMNSQKQNTTTEFLEQRYFVARVLLSGLRALLLQDDDNFTAEELGAVSKLLQAWRGKAENMSERFMLTQCQNAIWCIYPPRRPGSDLRAPACGACDLCGSKAKLHGHLAMNIRRAFDEQRASLPTGDDTAFWALYDILWAVEVNYIQWRADTPPGVHDGEYQSDLSVETLATKLAVTTPELYSVTVLLHDWRDTLRRNQPSPGRLLSKIDDSLKSLHTFLEERRLKLLDYNLEIRNLSMQFQDSIKSWIRPDPKNELRNSLGADQGPLLEAIYVLNCPSSHAITEHELRRQMNRPTSISSTGELLSNEDLRIQCPRCSSVANARPIDPLRFLSQRLNDLSQASNVSRGLGTSEAVQIWQALQVQPASGTSIEDSPSVFDEDPSRPDTPYSDSPSLSHVSPAASFPNPGHPEPRRASTVTQSTTSSTTPSTKGNTWLRRVRTLGQGSTLTVRSTNGHRGARTEAHSGLHSYGFSNDGNVLLLWDRSTDYIHASPISLPDDDDSMPIWTWDKFEVPGPKHVAAGPDRVAGISSENVLLVFSRLQKRKLFEEPLEKIQHTTCLAFSPDEAYIAVGIESTIRIYDIDNPHNLPEAIDLAPTPKSKFKSQRINFSQSGHRVVVATRNGAGDVKIVVFDRAKSAVHWSKTTDAVNTVSNDLGPCAIFYNKKNRVALPSFVSNAYFIIHSEKNMHTKWDPNKQGKVQAAVQCTTGSDIILLNADGELYNLNIDDKSFTQLPVAALGTKKQLPTANFVALAMPDSDTLYAFWVKDNDMILKVRRGSSNWFLMPLLGPTI